MIASASPLVLIVAVAFAAAAAVVAIVLVAVGVRGRRTDDHPLCRRCGFDLTGKPARTWVCGECGADLNVRKAVRVGNRTRWLLPLWTGTTIGLLWLCVAVGLGVAAWKGLDVNHYKPLWWLFRDADGTNLISRDNAFAELKRRMRVQNKPSAITDAIVDRALFEQADVARPWVVGWGDLMYDALLSRRLSDARLRRYAELLTPKVMIAVRPRLRQGARLLPMQLDFVLPTRVGQFTRVMVHNDLTCDAERIDNRVVPEPRPGLPGGADGIPMAVQHLQRLRWLTESGTAPIAVGQHNYTARYTIHMRTLQGSHFTDVLTIPIDVNLPFEVRVDDDRPDVVRHADASIKAELQQALTIDPLDPTGRYPGMITAWIHTGVKPLPIGVAFKMFLRAGGREWPLARFTFPAGAVGQRTNTTGIIADLPETLQRVDVVLRPDVEAAALTADLFEIWDGELTFPNVELRRPQLPSGRPTTMP